jgi:drug/metabolite transporter (DMT)-like permease
MRGAWQALLAALLFGASTPIAKTLLAGITPQVLAGLLYLGSGLGLGLLWVGRRARGSVPEAPLSRRDCPWLAGAVVFGGMLAPVLLMAGLARTPASASSLMLNLEGVFTALIAWIVFAENVDRRIALGMFAIVVGGAALSPMWIEKDSVGKLVYDVALEGIAAPR